MHHGPNLIPALYWGWFPLEMLIQMGVFLACWAVLHFLVFKPYVQLIKTRKEKTVGLLEKAEKDRAEAAALQEKYETFMKAERKKIVAWTDEERKKINEEERSIVGRARDEMGKELNDLREKIKAQTEQARKDLLPQIGDYSSHIVSKLVGYSVKVPSQLEPKKTKGAESTVRG